MIETANLTITQTQLSEIESALEEMLTGSNAASVLLINSNDGSLIAVKGLTEDLDTTSLAALAAGTFASAGEIARLVGEPEFTVLFHQGRRQHVHVNQAGEHGLLMTLFTDDTTLGLVRLCARKACPRVQNVLAG